eukprot:2755419-Pleurochrysis_carterae.AAC.2
MKRKWRKIRESAEKKRERSVRFINKSRRAGGRTLEGGQHECHEERAKVDTGWSEERNRRGRGRMRSRNEDADLRRRERAHDVRGREEGRDGL